MPKYLVTSGSNFEPFTYNDLVTPIAQMQEAHNAAVENMDALSLQSGAIASMLGPEDKRSLELYNNFNTELQSASDELFAKGYNSNTLRRFSALRKLYGRDITKINNAITKKAEAIKKFDEDVAKDRTLITERDPRLMSTDDWLDNPYAGNYQAYSGAVLQAQASKIGENMKTEFEENAGRWAQILGGQYYERNLFTGFHNSELRDAIYNESRGIQSNNPRVALLQNAIQTVYNSSGMSAWADPEQRARALNYIGDGLYSVIGEHKHAQLENKEYIDAYHSAQLAAQGRGSAAPVTAQLRGNQLQLGVDRGTYDQQRKTLELLTQYRNLKAAGKDRSSENRPTDEAVRLINALDKIPYYKNMSEKTPHYLNAVNLDEVIQELTNEIHKSVENDSHYQFNMDERGAKNVATNLFKPNIGSVGTGNKRDRKSLAGSVMHYAGSDKTVSPTDLQAILSSDNLKLGFDVRSGELTLERVGSDNSNNSSYDDRIIYLDPQTALRGEAAYVNTLALRGMLNESLKQNEISTTDVQKWDNIIEQLGNSGGLVDMRMLAGLLHDHYQDMIVDGNEVDLAIMNSLIQSFGQALYDSSNTPWSPNPYKESASAKK